MVDKSCRDGDTRRLAAAIVSGAYDYARDPRTGINSVRLLETVVSQETAHVKLGKFGIFW